jgi:hypothetical protein
MNNYRKKIENTDVEKHIGNKKQKQNNTGT